MSILSVLQSSYQCNVDSNSALWIVAILNICKLFHIFKILEVTTVSVHCYYYDYNLSYYYTYNFLLQLVQVSQHISS